jgi:hypothetical protein
MKWEARVAVRFMVPKPLGGMVYSENERRLIDEHLRPHLDFFRVIPSLVEKAICKLPQTRRSSDPAVAH